MTRSVSTRQRAPKSLPEGALACRSCGVLVAIPMTVEKVVAYGRQRRLGAGIMDVQEQTDTYAMTLCGQCSGVRQHASRLVDEHPRLAAQLGSRSYAADRIEAGLLALDALGVKAKRTAALVSTDRDLRMLLKLLPGRGTWAARFTPITDFDADPASASPTRWGHLTDEESQSLRDDFAALLHARIASPSPVVPPGGPPACMLCGVGAVSVLPTQAEDAWGRIRSANPGTLGGRRRPEPIRGHLCTECASAADDVGALGMTALEKALFRFLGVKRRDLDDVQLAGARAWIALPDGARPNATPWEHISNLADVKRDLNES
jgi:hypothetical protein